jgi:hypothetical protein
MATRTYSFLNEWFYPARPEDLWIALATLDLASGRLQRGRYLATALGVYTRPEMGNRYRVQVRSFFPYELQVEIELTALEYPTQIEGQIRGDLKGSGQLRLERVEAGTRVISEECVSIRRPLLRRLRLLLGPFFAWNHRWVLAQGRAVIINHLKESGELIETSSPSIALSSSASGRVA